MKKHEFWTVLTATMMLCGGWNTLSAQTDVSDKHNDETTYTTPINAADGGSQCP